MTTRWVLIVVPGLVFAAGRETRGGDPPSPTTRDPAAALEVLDRSVGELTLEAQSLASVLETLAQRAGTRFEIDDDTYATLPWGRETRLSSLRLTGGATLRKALDELLRPLGLVYRVGERSIMIESSPPLARMNRRATWDDLHFLEMLETMPFSSSNLQKIKFQYRITTKVNAPELLANQLKRAGDGSISEILTVATNALGWTWFPDKDHVVILSAQAHIAHNLARTITARYNQMGLSHILLDLAQKADVPLFLESGLMLKLPPHVANSYTLLLQQTTVRDALELICAETGLQYKILRDGVAISMGEAPGNAAGQRPRGDPYAARILVPAKNGAYSYEFLIRESEIPSDVREYRQQMIDEMIERMRQDMAPAPPRDAGGTAPATMPDGSAQR